MDISDTTISDCRRRHDWEALNRYIDAPIKHSESNSFYAFYVSEAENRRPDSDFIKNSYCSKDYYDSCLEKTLLLYVQNEKFYDLIHLSISQDHLIGIAGNALARSDNLEERYFRIKDMIDDDFGHGYEVLEKATLGLMKIYANAGRNAELLSLAIFAEEMSEKGHFKEKTDYKQMLISLLPNASDPVKESEQ